VSCGLCGPAKYLISTHGEGVNAKCGKFGSPLRVAARNGHLDAISLLLDHGADVNIVAENGCIPLCAAIFEQNLAVMHLAVMQLLLEHGASPDLHCSVGPLIYIASREGLADVIRLLLQHNANVNATDDADNSTALHLASLMGHVDITQILLDHGADINAISDHGTPLYRALISGHLEVVRLLLERGADMNIQGPDHQTPFQAATNRGCAQIAQLLL
jgi:ankyrin repeat protein